MYSKVGKGGPGVPEPQTGVLEVYDDGNCIVTFAFPTENLQAFMHPDDTKESKKKA